MPAEEFTYFSKDMNTNLYIKYGSCFTERYEVYIIRSVCFQFVITIRKICLVVALHCYQVFINQEQ